MKIKFHRYEKSVKVVPKNFNEMQCLTTPYFHQKESKSKNKSAKKDHATLLLNAIQKSVCHFTRPIQATPEH